MISALLDTSPEFAALWADHDVAFRRGDRKRLNHPTLGLIEVNCMNLLSEDGRQRLLWFTPAVGTERDVGALRQRGDELMVPPWRGRGPVMAVVC